VLALRHFAQLTVSETAAVLGIKEKAAGMRYIRALRRLKEILTSLGGLGGAMTMSASSWGLELLKGSQGRELECQRLCVESESMLEISHHPAYP
jgi:hypothetical protein